MKINNVSDPVAVLAIPTEEDLDVIEGILQHSYDEIEDEYVSWEEEPSNQSEWVVRRGSLCQELLAQCHQEMVE